jgi:bacillithiol biosynthesis cysteine-adding enzyme BshC
LNQEIALAQPRTEAAKPISSLPFSAIPGQTALFLQYLKDPLSLKHFYPNAVAGFSDLASYVPQVLDRYEADRSELCDVLDEVNTNAGVGAATFANIELLRDPDSVTVVTGQQAGLFSGPLYTIYKALTAIKAAELLRSNGIKAVPVFWAATEDHDFEEVSTVHVVERQGRLSDIHYRGNDDDIGQPVGSIVLGDSIGDSINELFGVLTKSEFSADLEEHIRETWKAGRRFGDAFIKTLSFLIRDLGLVLIDPMDRRLKNLASPIYIAAVERAAEIAGSVAERSRRLVTDGYHAQVKVEEDYFPLFWHDDTGRRTALRKIGDEIYRAQGNRLQFTVSELVEMARSEPERFSPGVMLRPVVQDHLLPSVCYIGGAAEIAYFAQNSEVYRLLDRPATPIFHRQSFTVIEARQRRALEKNGLKMQDLFEGAERTLLDTEPKERSNKAATLYADVEERINSELNRLDQYVSAIDPTLAENLAKRRRKIIYHISAMREKTLLAQARSDETRVKLIDDLFSAVLPEGQLQERILNVFYLLNRHGPNLIEWLYSFLDLNDKGHRIVDL